MMRFAWRRFVCRAGSARAPSCTRTSASVWNRREEVKYPVAAVKQGTRGGNIKATLLYPHCCGAIWEGEAACGVNCVPPWPTRYLCDVRNERGEGREIVQVNVSKKKVDKNPKKFADVMWGLSLLPYRRPPVRAAVSLHAIMLLQTGQEIAFVR